MCYIVCVTNIKDLKQTLALRVRTCLTANEVTQAELADALGLSRSTACQKVKGYIGFSAYEVAEISRLLNVSADSLLGLKPLEVE